MNMVNKSRVDELNPKFMIDFFSIVLYVVV